MVVLELFLSEQCPLLFFFFLPIMVKCLNIGKNIGKPIYRSISSENAIYVRMYIKTKYFFLNCYIGSAKISNCLIRCIKLPEKDS